MSESSFFGKFTKSKKPEGSPSGKPEYVKKVPNQKTSATDIMAQLEKSQTEMTKKIEELIESKTQVIKANADVVKSLDVKITKMEQTVSFEKKGVDDLKERLDKIDETVLELSSLYEVVSSTVNPFVTDNQTPSNEKLVEIEKKITELNKKSLNSNISEGLELRLGTLESSIEELKKLIESNPKKEDALIQKVAKIVSERIKPEIGQILESNPANTQTAPEISQKAPEASIFENHNQEVRLLHLDNKPETSIIILNWIEFLMEKVGRNNVVDVLEYYVEIGWISEDVSSKIIDYANGIDYYVERPTWKLLPEDHTKSLFFIEQLRGRKVDKNSLARFERDLNKIVRDSEALVSSDKLEL